MVIPTHWFWAKLGGETWPERYHPLVCHSLDVGHVAAGLWEHLRPPVRGRIAAALGVDAETAGRWIAFWIAAHDIGKLTPGFQAKGKSGDLRTRLPAGFDWPPDDPHHTLTGTKILRDSLTALGGWLAQPGLAEKVAVAVGGHHGTFPTDWNGIVAPLGNTNWADARRDLLNRLSVFPVGPFHRGQTGRGEHVGGRDQRDEREAAVQPRQKRQPARTCGCGSGATPAAPSTGHRRTCSKPCSTSAATFSKA